MKTLLTLFTFLLFIGCTESSHSNNPLNAQVPLSSSELTNLGSSDISSSSGASSSSNVLNSSDGSEPGTVDTTGYVLDSIRGIVFKRPMKGYVETDDLNHYSLFSDSSVNLHDIINVRIRRIEDTVSLRSKIHDLYIGGYAFDYEKIVENGSLDHIVHQYSRGQAFDTIAGVPQYNYFEIYVFVEYRFEHTIVDVHMSNIAMVSHTLASFQDTLVTSINFEGYADAPFSLANAVAGTMTDMRDAQEYKTTQIESQVWMAENLNYKVAGSYCYDDSEINCDTYGRLYPWLLATDSAQKSDAIPSGVQGLCPEGWHLPSKGEWQILESFISETAGNDNGPVLQATSGWGDYNGYDDLGFAALPSGIRYLDGSYERSGKSAYWLSTSYLERGYSTWEVSPSLGYLRESDWTRSYAVSIRCIQDS